MHSSNFGGRKLLRFFANDDAGTYALETTRLPRADGARNDDAGTYALETTRLPRADGARNDDAETLRVVYESFILTSNV